MQNVKSTTLPRSGEATQKMEADRSGLKRARGNRKRRPGQLFKLEVRSMNLCWEGERKSGGKTLGCFACLKYL